MTSSALISDCGKYRYRLSRVWNEQIGRVCFVMLNPSTATAEQDDPTIRRCIGFAKLWNFGGINVVNLYAYRTAYPKELWKAVDPKGIDNNKHIIDVAQHSELVVCAWGKHAKPERASSILTLLKTQLTIYQIGQYKFPRHPLMLPYTEKLVQL